MPDDTAPPSCSPQRLNEIRVVLDQVANKWSIMILTLLCDGPIRFNEIKRRIGSITHKSLTEALRRLERCGLIRREVICSSPVAVQYEITDLGITLGAPVMALLQWTENHASKVLDAQQQYDSEH
ncbi:helix-turn-helix domain-containing protein [Pseudomonas lijiangensis]|uniref:winged helix-turn-helix transcriptional regulator n=1 Tax=Pseudomonas syringae group TaxID=136849 RepID=UPI0018E5FA18|nr:helix-turn-helix domain-containing protein [Pseudomonas cichorii]MBI6854928.1 helix-turn-helix transcriptional regulator [Pseudomonas cichorii]